VGSSPLSAKLVEGSRSREPVGACAMERDSLLWRPGRVLDRDPIRERNHFGSIAISCRPFQLKTAKEEKLILGLPCVRVPKADRGAPGLILFGTIRREALQREGGAALCRRESTAIHEQANALESGSGPIKGFGFCGKFGIHRVLPFIIRITPPMASLTVPGA
jgi:hypothetical protein